MKTSTLLFILLLIPAAIFAQNRKGSLQLMPDSDHILYVAFSNSTISLDYESLAAEYGITARPAIAITPEKLEEMANGALKNTGSRASVDRLGNIYRLEVANPTNERLLELAKKLEALDNVAYCTLAPLTPVKPPLDIAPVTPFYEDSQNYIGTEGVNMKYAWNMGLNGQGINMRDVEYGFNHEHEELNSMNAFIASGMAVSPEVNPDYTEHGTAVMGIVMGDRGNYGISGLAYGVNETALFPEWAATGYNRYNAVTQSINASVPGDIIMYEMQMSGSELSFTYPDNYVPAEYDNFIWDLTKAATDYGIIIVAAAGNGAQDLDHIFYNNYMQRGDSGAIIVGAGSADEQHHWLDFSTYGSRVDVQGWGTAVLTSGYGNLYSIGNDFNQGYTLFGGTSSATPIVASCAAVLQSYYYGLTGGYLSPAEMRSLLQATGTPQPEGDLHIGPLPNMENAIAAIQNTVGVSSTDKPLFTAWPNPVQDKLMLYTETSGNQKAEVYNAVGQLVFDTVLNATTSQIDFSSYAAGIYMVKVTDGDKTTIRRIIKN